jgi:phage terminase small subunit
MKLTLKQEAFCLAYIETGNASEAYRRAYHASQMSAAAIDVEACRLLGHPKIAPRIAELQAGHRMRHEITIDRILAELARIGFSDIRKVVKWGPRALGEPRDGASGEMKFTNVATIVSSDEIDDDTAAAIAEVSQTRDGIKVKLHDKRAALIDMGKHLGIFKDQPGDRGSVPPQPEGPRPTGEDHLAGLSKRYAAGLRLIESKAPAEGTASCCPPSIAPELSRNS